MSDIIIAGIIDTRTGEITETVTRQKNKVALRLKVRDELNVEYGRDTFMVFELDSILGANLSYIYKKMKTDDPAATHQLELLNIRYLIHNKTENLARLEKELSIGENAFDKCCALFEPGSAELEFTESGLERELDEYRQTVEDCKYNLQRLRERLAEMESSTS